jgi:hypothetical protein
MLRPPDRDDVAHIGTQFPPGVFQSKHILNPNKEATDLDPLPTKFPLRPRRSSAKRKDIARFRTDLLLEPTRRADAATGQVRTHENRTNTQAVNADIRLRWNCRPDSDLYVLYTAGQAFASMYWLTRLSTLRIGFQLSSLILGGHGVSLCHCLLWWPQRAEGGKQ